MRVSAVVVVWCGAVAIVRTYCDTHYQSAKENHALSVSPGGAWGDVKTTVGILTIFAWLGSGVSAFLFSFYSAFVRPVLACVFLQCYSLLDHVTARAGGCVSLARARI